MQHTTTITIDRLANGAQVIARSRLRDGTFVVLAQVGRYRNGTFGPMLDSVEYVTWRTWVADHDGLEHAESGHYFDDDYAKALDDYYARAGHGVAPAPIAAPRFIG